MLFGLSYTSAFALGGAALVYYYGAEFLPGTINSGNRMMYALGVGAVMYFMKTGDMMMNMLSM